MTRLPLDDYDYLTGLAADLDRARTTLIRVRDSAWAHEGHADYQRDRADQLAAAIETFLDGGPVDLAGVLAATCGGNPHRLPSRAELSVDARSRLDPPDWWPR